MRFSKNKQLYYIPLVLILKVIHGLNIKAFKKFNPSLAQSLVDTTDVHIFSEIMKGSEDDMFLKGCVCVMS